MKEQGTVEINENIRPQLIAEYTKRRSFTQSSILTPEMKDAVKRLHENDNIIVRRADKSSFYVILNKQEYFSKSNTILSDDSKFKPITKGPTQSLQRKINTIIKANNSIQHYHQLPTVIGEYSPGYIYGNVKTHKQNNPLRPIISLVTTPTYKIAEELTKIIAPYIPTKYSLKSTDEFIDLLHCSNATGIPASSRQWGHHWAPSLPISTWDT